MNLRQNILEWGFNLSILFLLVYGHLVCPADFDPVWMVGGLFCGIPLALLFGWLYWIFCKKNFREVTFRTFRMVLFILVVLALWQVWETRQIQKRVRDEYYSRLLSNQEIKYEDHRSQPSRR